MDDRYQQLVDWLKARQPDDWHRVALSWNWDNPTDILMWIAAQQSCDRATAQMMFHQASPDHLLTFSSSELARASGYAHTHELCTLIARNWNAAHYTRSEILSYPDLESMGDRLFYRAEEALIAPSMRPWTIEDSIFVPLSGRDIHADDYDAGFPPELAED